MFDWLFGPPPVLSTVDGDELHPGHVVSLRSAIGAPYMTVQRIGWNDGRWMVRLISHGIIYRSESWYDAHVLVLAKDGDNEIAP